MNKKKTRRTRRWWQLENFRNINIEGLGDWGTSQQGTTGVHVSLCVCECAYVHPAAMPCSVIALFIIHRCGSPASWWIRHGCALIIGLDQETRVRVEAPQGSETGETKNTLTINYVSHNACWWSSHPMTRWADCKRGSSQFAAETTKNFSVKAVLVLIGF